AGAPVGGGGPDWGGPRVGQLRLRPAHMVLHRVPGIATEHTRRHQPGVAALPPRPALRPPMQTSHPRPHGLMQPSEMAPELLPQPDTSTLPGPRRTTLPDSPPHDGIECREDEKPGIDCVHRVLRGLHPSSEGSLRCAVHSWAASQRFGSGRSDVSECWNFVQFVGVGGIMWFTTRGVNRKNWVVHSMSCCFSKTPCEPCLYA